jgi:hypothetical protein
MKDGNNVLNIGCSKIGIPLENKISLIQVFIGVTGVKKFVNRYTRIIRKLFSSNIDAKILIIVNGIKI